MVEDGDCVVVKRSDLEEILEEIRALRGLVAKEFRSERSGVRKQPSQASRGAQ